MMQMLTNLRKGRLPAVLLAAAVLLTGCGWGDETDDPTQPGPPVGIGPSGGQVVAGDGLAMVTIPEGALDQVVEISVTPAADPPAGAVPGTVYDFGPDGTQFAVPVTVAVAYDPAQLPEATAENLLQLCAWDSDAWLPLDEFTLHAGSNYLDGPTDHFSLYGITVGDEPQPDAVAYLKDDPDPGAPDQFASLTAAVAWLEARLGYEEIGTLVWQTSTAQEVDELSFNFDLVIEVDPGADPAITATGSGTLFINAGGALDLAGFTIGSDAGLVINTNRALNLDGCRLPGSVSVNIGGVQGAPFPAGDPGYVARDAAAAKLSVGTVINANRGMSHLSVQASASSTVSGDITVSGNETENLTVVSEAQLYPDVTLTVAGPSAVPVPYPIIDTRLGGTSRVVVRDFAQSQHLQTMINAMGDNPVTIRDVVSARHTLDVQGPGTVSVLFVDSQVDSSLIRAAANDSRIVVENLECTGRMVVEAPQASGQLQVDMTGGSYGGGVHVEVPGNGDAQVTLEGTSHTGGTLFVGGQGSGGGSGGRGGTINLTDLVWNGAGTDHIDIYRTDATVTVSRGSFTHTGSPAVILGLTEVEGTISIDQAQLTGAGIGLVDCTGTATITDTGITVTSASAYGLSLGGSSGVTVQDCTITGASGGIGVLLVGEMNGAVNITGCTLDGSMAAVCATFAGSTVNLDDNEQVSGAIHIVDSQVHMSGNTFSGAMVWDDYTSPGLLNDPVQDNDGLLAGMCFTRMDWDGNGCCDYPPEWNQTDENGNCTVCDGVAGKTAVWR